MLQIHAVEQIEKKMTLTWQKLKNVYCAKDGKKYIGVSIKINILIKELLSLPKEFWLYTFSDGQKKQPNSSPLNAIEVIAKCWSLIKKYPAYFM